MILHILSFSFILSLSDCNPVVGLKKCNKLPPKLENSSLTVYNSKCNLTSIDLKDHRELCTALHTSKDFVCSESYSGKPSDELPGIKNLCSDEKMGSVIHFHFLEFTANFNCSGICIDKYQELCEVVFGIAMLIKNNEVKKPVAKFPTTKQVEKQSKEYFPTPRSRPSLDVPYNATYSKYTNSLSPILVICVCIAFLYFAYTKKNMILAYLIEGPSSSGRRRVDGYRPVATNQSTDSMPMLKEV